MTTSLTEARDHLRDQLQHGEAVECPCCTQLAKIYRRTIHATMAHDLIALYRHGGDSEGWLHVPTVLNRRHPGDLAKLAYWGLIEPMPAEREDGSKRTGWWRLTNLGRSFVRGHVSVGKYARVYDGRCLGIDMAETVDIGDCLGDKFNYRELMSA